MPAATTLALSTAAALAGTGMSIAQMQQAKKAQKDAEAAASAAANAFKNIKEGNAYMNLQVPTLGYDLAQQGIDRAAIDAVRAAQSAGSEGVIGALPGIVQATAGASLEKGAELQQEKYLRDVAQAQAQQDINQRKATREEDLAKSQIYGAQAQRAQAVENKNKAIAGIFSSLGGVAEGVGGMVPLYFKQGEGSIPATTGNTYGVMQYNSPNTQSNISPFVNSITGGPVQYNQYGTPTWLINQ